MVSGRPERGAGLLHWGSHSSQGAPAPAVLWLGALHHLAVRVPEALSGVGWGEEGPRSFAISDSATL